VIDKKVRPLPKKLSNAQKIVLATYPNARSGSAKAFTDIMKPFWETHAAQAGIFTDFGKNAKWVIYTEPDNPDVVLFVNVIGIHNRYQREAWKDAAAIVSKFMMFKLSK